MSHSATEHPTAGAPWNVHPSAAAASPAPSAAACGESSTQGSPSDGGLGSLRGIRWLLLAGALVTGVSIYRLVGSQWQLIPVAFQFLILVAGALGLYACGEVSRSRLRLPSAGGALLLLFATLIPVLSWGAVYLKLLGTGWGWVTFAAGTAALLWAARRTLAVTLGYRGLVYPGALGVLVLSQPILPQLRQAWPDAADALYLAAAVVLGAVLHMGARHVNRFFFHRDRRQSKERPVHWVPFVLLSGLYLGAMTLLDSTPVLWALPLAVIGWVLTSTGEEYYRALAHSLGEAPRSWPRRSVALLSLGFAAMLTALPLALLDPSLRCLALVSLGVAVGFLRWAWRYQSAMTHVTGGMAALVAYHALPALVPGVAEKCWGQFLAFLGLGQGSLLAVSFADLGFLAGLVAYALLLRRSGAGPRMQSAHGFLTTAHLLWLAVMALFDSPVPGDATVFLLMASTLAVLGIFASRRLELVLAVHGVLALLTLTLGTILFATGSLFATGPVSLLAAVTLAATLASRWFVTPLANLLDLEESQVERALLLAAGSVAVAMALHGLSALWANDVLAGIELILTGAVLLEVGRPRHGSGAALACGGLLLPLGVSSILLIEPGPGSPSLALVTQLFFALSWIAGRIAVRQGSTAWLTPCRLWVAVHGLAGLFWLLYAALHSSLTVELLILPLMGLALVDEGLVLRRRFRVLCGLALGVLYLPLQLLASVQLNGTWGLAVVVVLATAAGVLLAQGHLCRFSTPGSSRPWLATVYGLAGGEYRDLVVGSLRALTRAWSGLALAACLILAGTEVLGLASLLLGVVLLGRVALGYRDDPGPVSRDLATLFPWRLTLLLGLHFSVVLAGTAESYLLPALADCGWRLLPTTAVGAALWGLLVHRFAPARSRPTHARGRWSAWALGLEGVVAFSYLAAFFAGVDFSFAENVTLVGAAALFAGLRLRLGLSTGQGIDAWALQAWVGLALLQGVTAGWIEFGRGLTPWVLLVMGGCEYALAAYLARNPAGRVFSPACRRVGLALPLIAGLVSLSRAWSGDGISVWLLTLPAFAVSLFFLVVAYRESRRIAAALISAGFLGAALFTVLARYSLGGEFYFLAPGLALMGLAYLLRAEMGAKWSRHLATAGAACVYATPVVALSEHVSEGWLAVLLVLTVIFGAIAFHLRSRSLLTVSTAAMFTDLGFFVFHIGSREPLLLWLAGLAFGLALMAFAAYLEYRREGLFQQVRILRRELQSWS